MARTVYSRCLYAQNPQLGSLPLGFPLTDTAVIRDISLLNVLGALGQLFIRDEAGVALVLLQVTPSVPYAHWEGRQVVNPGDTVSVEVDGSQCSVRICGYLLSP